MTLSPHILMRSSLEDSSTTYASLIRHIRVSLYGTEQEMCPVSATGMGAVLGIPKALGASLLGVCICNTFYGSNAGCNSFCQLRLAVLLPPEEAKFCVTIVKLQTVQGLIPYGGHDAGMRPCSLKQPGLSGMFCTLCSL